MTEKVLSIKSVEKKRVVKPKIEPVSPIQIVDIWRLVDHSLRQGLRVYPDLTEESPDAIRAHLFAFLQKERFTGLVARIGKRPIGAILGEVVLRGLGRPSRFAAIDLFWVEPQYRGNGIAKALWSEYTARLKKAGIFHFEARASEALEKLFVKESVSRIYSVIGGRI